jgi:tRNA uridine 5-carboxymethylaminomethyl modification enzyme
MFSSRAEDRLHLRQENADQRLTPRGFEIGLIDRARWACFEQKMALIEGCRSKVSKTKVDNVPLNRLLKRADFSYVDLAAEIQSLAPAEIWELVENEVKYEGYALRQAQQNQALQRNSLQKIPDGFDFGVVTGLSSEARQKLSRVRPMSLGDAARISGVTQSDISILHIWLNKRDLGSSIDQLSAAQSN